MLLLANEDAQTIHERYTGERKKASFRILNEILARNISLNLLAGNVIFKNPSLKFCNLRVTPSHPRAEQRRPTGLLAVVR